MEKMNIEIANKLFEAVVQSTGRKVLYIKDSMLRYIRMFLLPN